MAEHGRDDQTFLLHVVRQLKQNPDGFEEGGGGVLGHTNRFTVGFRVRSQGGRTERVMTSVPVLGDLKRIITRCNKTEIGDAAGI